MALTATGPVADAAAAWGLIGDTDHLNRAVDNPPLTMNITPDEMGFPVLTGTVLGPGPVRHAFEEVELLWIQGQRFRQVRQLKGPMLKRAVYEATLAPEGQGVLPTISVEMISTYSWMQPLINAITARGLRRWLALLTALPRPGQAPSSPALRSLPGAVQTALERWQQGGADEALIGRVTTHFRHARDRQLRALDAFALADAWGMDRRSVLVGFLEGTAVGALELYWSVRCPRCRAGVATADSLSNLPDHAGCASCRIDFRADLEDSVEVLFAAPPQLRPPPGEQFCTLFPASRADVLVMAILQPGQEERFTIELPAGTCRIGVGGEHPDLTLQVGEQGEDSWTWTPSAVATPLRAGPTTLTLRNPTAHRLRVDLSHLQSRQGVSAAYLATMPEHRRRFGPQVLAADVRIGVRAIAILFTDLTGSAALYHEHGDATAFRFVHEHFAVLDAAVEASGGVRVKTIGDALMAAFHTPLQAVKAARQMLREFDAWVQGWDLQRRPGLKIGMHFGPAMAVHSDSAGLDYFGGTVNLAARAEGKASGGQAIWTAEIEDDPDVRRLLSSLGEASQRFEAPVKGLPEPMVFYAHAPVSG